jgi:ABC-2 type transport system ATP-binding protein
VNDIETSAAAPPPPEVLLSVTDVGKSYGAVRALEGVSLSVAAGEFVALLGANGAGKSTLMQLLTGLFTPDSGSISVLGHDMRTDAVAALAGIGVVFQQQTLDLELSVRANLVFHADLHGIPRAVARQRIAAALAHYGLSERMRARARVLSGGNRRRVELARALLHQPRVLLMDEATVGLDPASRRELLDEMNRLKTAEGIGILWTTHLVDEIERADRFIVLRRGHVTFAGTRADLMASAPDGDLGAAVIRLMDAGEPDPTPPLPRAGGPG